MEAAHTVLGVPSRVNAVEELLPLPTFGLVIVCAVYKDLLLSGCFRSPLCMKTRDLLELSLLTTLPLWSMQWLC